MFGNRTEVDVTVGATTTTTRYAYDMWNPAKAGATGTANSDIWATFTSGSLITRQLQGDGVDQHLAYVTSSNAYWYLTDHLNSSRAVINNSGTVQDSIVYDGYGNITYQTPSPATTPLYFYTGREFDVETGLQYNRARYYDATTGRWMSQDPMGFDAGDLTCIGMCTASRRLRPIRVVAWRGSHLSRNNLLSPRSSNYPRTTLHLLPLAFLVHSSGRSIGS